MTPKEYKQMMDYLTRSGIRKQVKFASDIARPDPKPEIKEIEAINAFMKRNPRADGGRIGFQRPLTTVGKTADIVNYLKDLPNGSSFYKPDVAKLLNLGTAKDGSIDTSLLTTVINSRPELKNKKFKFLTKTDVTVNKINNFVQNYVNENKGKLPSQGEIQKGAKVDPTRLRNYITEGLIKNVADTVFDKNTKVANYILESKNPTIKDIEKIVGKGNANKILTRVYINSLRSTKDKLNKIDEGRSVYKNFNLEQVDLIKNKLRKIPGFESIYEREITDLVADAYPGKKNLKKKKAALKKIAKFKELNKTLKNKFGINQVLEHPLDYDFITKTTAGSDPTELIRVRPLPERVNTFKSLLTKDFTEISETLKKGYNQAAYDKYLDVKSIADDLGIAFPKMAKTGTITSPAAAKIGDKPIIGDIKQSAVIQNKFREFVQNISNDPRIQRLGINIKELKDLAKLPKVNVAKYDAAINKFIQKSGKFGLPFAAGYFGVRELSTPAQAGGGGEAAEFTTGEKLAGAGTAAGAYKFRKPIIKGAKAVGRGALKLLGPLAVPLEAGFVLSDLKSGSTVPEALADVVMAGGIFREKDKRKFIEDKYGTETLNRYVAAKTPGITDVMDMPTAVPALSQELQAIDAEADAYLQTLRNQRAQEFERKSNLPRPEINPFQAAGGGIAKMAGVSSGPPPESGPNSQGLQGLMKRVKKL